MKMRDETNHKNRNEVYFEVRLGDRGRKLSVGEARCGRPTNAELLYPRSLCYFETAFVS